MKNKLIAILHADLEYGIGKNNSLVLHLPKDMSFFKEKTSGHAVAMGENTLLSFPGGRPLKNRTNIVLSMDKTHEYPDCINVHSFDDFKNAIKDKLENGDVFIIGGASIYKQTLPYVDEVLLTRVHEMFHADVFFPNLNESQNFVLEEESEKIEDNGHMVSFCRYVNKNKINL